MPTVPRPQREEQVGGIPGAAPLPQFSPNAPAEAFGGGAALDKMGQGFDQIGAALAEAGKKEKEKADDTATTEYYVKLARKKQELFYDSKTGVVTKKGKDSFSAVDDYGKQFDEFANSIEQGMSTSQIAMAKKIRMKERLEFDGQLMRHVAQESDQYQDQSVKAGIAVAREDAILSGDPATVAEKIKFQEAIYSQTAGGKPPALVEAEMKEIRGKTHFGVLKRMVDNGQDLAAKNYFEKVKGELYQDTDEAERLLKAGNLAGESQRRSDQIFATSRTIETAFTEVQKIQDPTLRDETSKRLKDLYSMKNLMEKDREEQNLKYAANILDQSGNTDRIPRSTWNTFSPGERAQLENYAKHKREGTQPATNWGEYYNLKTMAADPRLREQYMRVNLMQYRDRLADSEFKDLVNAQEGLRKGDDKTAKLLDGVRTNAEIVNTALKKAGIDPEAKSGNDVDAYGLFRQKVDERVVALQTQTGNPVSSKELSEITDDLIIEGVTQKGWFWDTKKRKYELAPGERLQFEIKDVPAAERAKIEAALKKKGLKVTDDKVLDLYSRKAGL